MELSLKTVRYYRVKRGQTLALIAKTFCVPACILAKENALVREPEEGQVLKVPAVQYNRYTVRGGESKSLLCGSPARFEEINGTKRIYPAQVVFFE